MSRQEISNTLRERMKSHIQEIEGVELVRVPRKRAWFQTTDQRNILLLTSKEDERGIIWIALPPDLLQSEEKSNMTGQILIAVTPYRKTVNDCRFYGSKLDQFVDSWIDAGRPEKVNECHAFLDVSLGSLKSSSNARFGGISMHRIDEL